MTLEQYIQIATNLSRKTDIYLHFIPVYDNKYWFKEEKLLEFKNLYVIEDWYNYCCSTGVGDFNTYTITVRLSNREIRTKLKALDSLFQQYFTRNDLLRRFKIL